VEVKRAIEKECARLESILLEDLTEKDIFQWPIRMYYYNIEIIEKHHPNILRYHKLLNIWRRMKTNDIYYRRRIKV
jgi:hypothetical protein